VRKVLIVDDDALFAESLADALASEGYEVASVPNEAELELALAERPAHVVLLDVRLDGPGWSGSDGVDRMPALLGRWPLSRVVVVSGAVTETVVRRAFQAGATDILEKNQTGVLFEMLRHKVRAAAEQAERDFVAYPPTRERELKEAWLAARTETHRQRKGEALERAVTLLFGSIPGLTGFQRTFNGTEEFDVYVQNDTVGFLQQQGPVWIVECKNWTASAGVAEVHPLVQKMRHRYGRCRLGFLIAMNGFAATVTRELERESTTDLLVVTLDQRDVSEWIAAADRVVWLRQRILAASSR
jgi:DNA-binding NarL/FixJ family response regulator